MKFAPLKPIVLRLVICGLFGLVVSACASETQAAEEQVRKGLTDPDSAQFRNLAKHGDYACGEVNAKNKMGGYNGFRRFYVAANGGSAAIVDPQAWASPEVTQVFGKDILTPSIDTNVFETVYNRVCR